MNVFPRSDDPVPANPGDQLGPLYEAGLHNLWENLVAEAQTLDNLFVNDGLYGDLIEMRAAHINAGWAASDEANGSKGSSDHDPQIARFRSRAALSAASASVVEGDRGTTPLAFPVTLSRPLSRPMTVCATTVPGSALPTIDFEPYVGCKVIPAGSTGVVFEVRVRGDKVRERDETFKLAIAGLEGLRLIDATATGTIKNDD
ncbi:hypothetical protein Adi01nite_62130 [Amorphoplanes digitatis]|uniref:Calx-beta domain-containing protein n=1 Tax=Actinoplanes digitatis TaxID=1868 RepID=A0A7W7MM66_9ACTN|nr:hypothetical protein [Actinoplanes digitatis]MBB4759711.1 hypothetical protein [Actinoplanes digitatis]GID96801.1 hypothetical protein Adi01nite_62130 [Actinoplanes digitatis]